MWSVRRNVDEKQAHQHVTLISFTFLETFAIKMLCRKVKCEIMSLFSAILSYSLHTTWSISFVWEEFPATNRHRVSLG